MIKPFFKFSREIPVFMLFQTFKRLPFIPDCQKNLFLSADSILHPDGRVEIKTAACILRRSKTIPDTTFQIRDLPSGTGKIKSHVTKQRYQYFLVK